MSLRFVGIFAAFAFASIALAQDFSCPIVEQAATAESSVWCADLSEGQACLGNAPVRIDATTTDAFQIPGDTVSLDQLSEITTLAGDDEYGISLLYTRAYTPTSWTPYDLHMVLLGSVQLGNLGVADANVPAVAAPIVGTQGVNVRSGPGTEYRILTPLFADDIVKVTGQHSSAAWLRIQTVDGGTGWIAAGAVAADIRDLPVVDSDSPAPDLLYAPFADLMLETGVNDARCDDIHDSGLLMQSSNAAEIRVRINGTPLLFDGTVFVQAVPDESLAVHVIQGSATLGETTADDGFTLTQTTNSQDVRVVAYDFARMATLPTQMLPQYTVIGINLTALITPAPTEDVSPLAAILVDAPCTITTGEGGSNLRSGPGRDFPIRGVLAFRESARPIGRALDANNMVWWELAQNVWVSGATTVTGGDCVAVPQSNRVPVLLPTATPAN